MDAADIAAVSTTCMREGIVLYDEAGQEIWACANVDARSDDEVGQLIRMNPELEKEIYRESARPTPWAPLPRILWVKNKLPETLRARENRQHVQRLADLQAHRRAQDRAQQRLYHRHLDLQKRRWDAAIMRKVGLKDDIFPPVAECGEGGQPGSMPGARRTRA